MSSSHNSSGTTSTAVPTSTTVPNQISAMGSTSPGWLNELQNLGYVSNTATLPTGTMDSTGAGATSSLGANSIAQLVANSQMSPASQQAATAGNAGLLKTLLGSQYKGVSS